MQLSELFTADDFVLGLHASDKWDAIRVLMGHLVARHGLDPALGDEVHAQVLTRERSMSTGMERGIAIPHAAVEGIDRVLACIGVVADEEGLDFESIDARPTRLVVLLLIPRAHKLLHIRTLADIARVLGQSSVREALLAATTGEEAVAALAEGERAHPV